ncbi:MAG: Smr/MutS family protein [Deltaproteobacteria bacterium]|jgi:DNA-nicking Smr family endonuclease|nr:Smr/MutS family protein [Deltaproteobacteria bacterium]
MGKKKQTTQKTPNPPELPFRPPLARGGGEAAGLAAKERQGADGAGAGGADAEVFFNPFQTLQYSFTPGKRVPGHKGNFDKKIGNEQKQQDRPTSPNARVKSDDRETAVFQEAMAAQGFQKAAPAGLKKNGRPSGAPAGLNALSALSELEEQEAGLFAEAMRGVSPVDGKGRDLPLKLKAEAKVSVVEANYLKDFLEGKIEFALEYTEEFFEGHVVGFDPLVATKLRAGQYSPEATVDLHGQNAEQARETLINFIHQAYNKSQRFLIVVTGRGKNSPGGLGILRQNLREWLTQNPLKRVVLAFCSARAKDGGTGAVYILLRKFKKSSGKIQWDRRET